jgi:Short C-terminal domain
MIAETRMMFQRVILAEYEKLVGKEEPVPSGRSASEHLRALEQLKNDGLINEEEYNSKRKEILENFSCFHKPALGRSASRLVSSILRGKQQYESNCVMQIHW